MKIRLSGIVTESIVDGHGIRYVVFTQGCYHNCYKCHNPQTHDINGGYLKDIDEIIAEINSQPYLTGITLSGGEPFLQINECLEIVSKINRDLDVIAYTGFTYEVLLEKSKSNKSLRDLLNHIDYLIDGKFDLSLKDLTLAFKGSKNQRIINLKESILSKKLTLKDF